MRVTAKLPCATLVNKQPCQAKQWDGTPDGAAEIADWLENKAFIRHFKKVGRAGDWVILISNSVVALVPDAHLAAYGWERWKP